MSLHDFRHDMLHRGHVLAQIAECAHISSDRDNSFIRRIILFFYRDQPNFLVLFSDTSHENLDPLSVFLSSVQFLFFSSCLTDVALCACNFCVCAQPPQYSPGIRVVCSGVAISVFFLQDHVITFESFLRKSATSWFNCLWQTLEVMTSDAWHRSNGMQVARVGPRLWISESELHDLLSCSLRLIHVIDT